MLTIAKTFTFSASHQLTHLPATHPCARLHGHNYTVELQLHGSVDPETGFVLDYRAFDAFKTYLDDALDHRHLNDALGSSVATTAENLATALLALAESLFGPRVLAVRVSETPKTWAEARRTP